MRRADPDVGQGASATKTATVNVVAKDAGEGERLACDYAIRSPSGTGPAPRALPRTGEAENWAIGGMALAGVALLGAGVITRRRCAS